MNNLMLSSLVFAAGAIVWSGQHVSLKHARDEARALTADLAAAQITRYATSAAFSEAQASLVARRDETKSAQVELDTAMREARTANPVPPIDPASEGYWPADRPYFYLSKKYLGTIGYPGFTKDHHLSAAAALLFGLTGAEKSAVDAACNSFYDRVDESQFSHAERLDSKPGINTDNHREISFRVPIMSNELSEARSTMSAGIREAIGEERARYLLVHVHGDFELPVSTMSSTATNAIVSLQADRMPDGNIMHRLKIETPGVGSMFDPVYFPLTPDSELWQYRHLFGDQPLIPLPTPAQQDK